LNYALLRMEFVMSITRVEGEVLTVDETARVLRISRQMAYKSVRDGTIPSVRIGDRILVPRVRLNALLNGA
jgi:excisionase family DNA binding protein